MLVARMSSKGPQYDAVVKAAAMLGQRAVRKGQIRYAAVEVGIQDQLSLHLSRASKDRAPSQQMVRDWTKQQPDFPEWAVGNGLVSAAALPAWARGQLAGNAQLSQSRLKPTPTAAPPPGSAPSRGPSLGGVLALVLGLVVAVKVLNALSAPRAGGVATPGALSDGTRPYVGLQGRMGR